MIWQKSKGVAGHPALRRASPAIRSPRMQAREDAPARPSCDEIVDHGKGHGSALERVRHVGDPLDLPCAPIQAEDEVADRYQQRIAHHARHRR